MKFVVLILLPVLSACSFLDQIQFNEGHTLNPNTIYLNNETVKGSRDELDKYACLSGAPLVCTGSTYPLSCHC